MYMRHEVDNPWSSTIMHIPRFDTNIVEGLAGEVKLCGKLNKDIRYLVLVHLVLGPQRETLQQLLCGDQELCHCGFDRVGL